MQVRWKFTNIYINQNCQKCNTNLAKQNPQIAENIQHARQKEYKQNNAELKLNPELPCSKSHW